MNELYLSAKKLEESQELNEEIAIWDDNFGQDGLDDI